MWYAPDDGSRNCIWLKTGELLRQTSLTHIQKNDNGLCGTLCVLPKKIGFGWNKYPSTVEWRLEAKWGQIQALCAKEKAPTTVSLLSSKQNWINSQRNVQSIPLDANLNVRGVSLILCEWSWPTNEKKGVLRSEPGRTADIVPINILPPQVFSWRAFKCLATASPLLFAISVEDGSTHFFPHWSSFKSSQRTFHLQSGVFVLKWEGSENVQTSQNSCRKKKPQRG